MKRPDIDKIETLTKTLYDPTISFQGLTWRTSELIAYIRHLEKQNARYRTDIAIMLVGPNVSEGMRQAYNEHLFGNDKDIS